MRTVRLLRRHQHAGVDYAPGALVVLTERNAQRLVDQGIAEAVALPALLTASPAKAAATKTPAKATAPTIRRGCCGLKW